MLKFAYALPRVHKLIRASSPQMIHVTVPSVAALPRPGKLWNACCASGRSGSSYACLSSCSLQAARALVASVSLSHSPSRTLVTPYCKRTRPGRRTTRRPRVPLLLFSPLCAPSRAELKYFLGFQVKQLQEGTFISQTKYTQDILCKFGMKDAKPIKTPMGTNEHLDLDTRGKSIDQKVYRSMIRSLLYLCASRLDIMLSVCMCARFKAKPKEVHLRAMKRIMRYLVYTPKFGL